MNARMADRCGNRPFMIFGMLMQTGGLACLAIIAARDAAFLQMAPLLTVAGAGTAMVFPALSLKRGRGRSPAPAPATLAAPAEP